MRLFADPSGKWSHCQKSVRTFFMDDWPTASSGCVKSAVTRSRPARKAFSSLRQHFSMPQ